VRALNDIALATLFSAVSLVAGCAQATQDVSVDRHGLIDRVFDKIPKNLPIPDSAGFAASFHPAGSIDLRNDFFTPQGSNGRHCGTCHAPEDGWSITPATVVLTFLLTAGTDPLFVNNLDTDTPTSDMSTPAARWSSTTMLRQGKFTRKVAPPAVRDYEVIAASDPFGVGTTSSLWFFRRPLPTASFRSATVMWDGANTVATGLRDGLIKQARSNVTGAQQGAPAPDAVIFDIVDYENALAFAQLSIPSVGRLDSDGAHGGPDAASAQPLVEGRFDLYDAWQHSNNPHRRQIWRGQEIFNNVNPPSGRRCGGCHTAANNGQNVSGQLFDVGLSRPELARPDMAVYTFRRTSDGAILQTTDPGRGIRTGNFADLDHFKVPSLRGLAARAPYFHNGFARDLDAVVDFYNDRFSLKLSAQEHSDLVAFLRSL
jgi:cytochrome c peroxidase